MVSSYFITGTGRCGTLLLSKVLGCSNKTHCNHEFSMKTLKMKEAYFKSKMKIYYKEIDNKLAPTIKEYNGKNLSYGECSSHLYFIYPELFRRYEYTSRFALLVRRPENFIRSALARGFFSPDHPRGLEHVRPPKDIEIGRIWDEITPFEKCAWYWAMVNGYVYRYFQTIPHAMFKIIKLEELDLEICRELYELFQLDDFDEVKEDIKEVLGVRYNASPGQGDESALNPFSEEIKLGVIDSWSENEKEIYRKYVEPVERAIYGLGENNVSKIGNLSKI